MTHTTEVAAWKLGFLVGAQAGVKLALEALRSTVEQVDTNRMTTQFVQLANDWAVLMEERIAAGDDWSGVQDDLEVMRMQEALDRGIKTMFRET